MVLAGGNSCIVLSCDLSMGKVHVVVEMSGFESD